MRMAFIALVALIIVAATPAPAQSAANDSIEYSKCLKNSGGVDPAILDCISAEYARADQRLNQAYKTLLNTLKPERKKALQETQRLWLKFTQANCNFYRDPEGGTSAHLAASECEMTVRAARALELETFIKSQADIH